MSGIIGMNDWERHWKPTREHVEKQLADEIQTKSVHKHVDMLAWKLATRAQHELMCVTGTIINADCLRNYFREAIHNSIEP